MGRGAGVTVPFIILERLSDFSERTRLKSGKNIFLLETSCPEDGYAKLSCRQACSVESTALMNPSLSVNLLYLSPSPPSDPANLVIQQLLEYSKVHVNRIKVADYMRDTPIERWYFSGIINTSNWPNTHMSDVLRYLTLWKFGGIYLDLDVIVTT